MAVQVDRHIDQLKRMPIFGRYLFRALSGLQDGINNLAVNIAADATKNLPPPPPPQKIDVKTDNKGFVHAVITDHGQIRRGINYFVEYANEPTFLQPHVKSLHASRTMEQIALPALHDDGVTPQRWYFRTYSQYPHGKASAKILFGGDTATAVNPGGTQALTLLPSTGSGTAPANGQSAGQGFGDVLHRPATFETNPR